MSKLLRYYNDGQIYFITNAVDKRQPILIENHELLLCAINHTKKRLPFNLIAYVILPDHLHLLIDPLDNNLSGIMHRFKLSFGARYRNKHNFHSVKLWQGRFWDHIIRDENDMNNHIDYIHYNPVKHGYVSRPIEWKYSSFERYLNEGFYSEDWGITVKMEFSGEYGDDK